MELDGASILVENNMIRKIFAKGDALPQADKVIDVNGEMTVPGFVDVHCHGKSGVDFSDAKEVRRNMFIKEREEFPQA